MKDSKSVQFNNLVRKHLVGSSKASNLSFNEKIKQMKASGSLVYHFGFGESPFPIPECLVRALQEEAYRKEYLNINGTPELRQGIVDFHCREQGINLTSEGLIVGPGSKQIIYLVLTVFDGGVIVPAPAWTTYAPQVQLAGLPLITAKTDASFDGGYKITPQLLLDSIKGYEKKNLLLILTNPGNPTGTCYTEKELRDLSSVCRDRGIVVLSDEIYSSLIFKGRHSSIQQFYPEGTILASGFSKWASAGGWRVGYAHFPASLISLHEAVSLGASHTYSCASAPMMYALAKVLKENHQELHEYIEDCSKILEACGDYCFRELAKEGVTGTKGEGGYYFMPDFGPLRDRLNARGIYTGKQMTQSMLDDANVALMPSSNFLMPEDDLSTRFCFISFDGRSALEAVRKLRNDGRNPEDDKSFKGIQLGDGFVKRYCSDIVDGVSSLRAWCNNL